MWRIKVKYLLCVSVRFSIIGVLIFVRCKVAHVIKQIQGFCHLDKKSIDCAKVSDSHVSFSFP